MFSTRCGVPYYWAPFNLIILSIEGGYIFIKNQLNMHRNVQICMKKVCTQ